MHARLFGARCAWSSAFSRASGGREAASGAVVWPSFAIDTASGHRGLADACTALLEREVLPSIGDLERGLTDAARAQPVTPGICKNAKSACGFII